MSNLTHEQLEQWVLRLSHDFETYKEQTAENLDAFFLCTMSLIIFLMQCGFAFLEAGAVRSKNTTNIIFKNVLDSLFALLCYWVLGWALAYGPAPSWLSAVTGGSQFFLIGLSDYTKFFFQYVFAATAATIVAGAVAERCEILAYIVYCCSISGVVYPVLTHWAWDPAGWMARGFALRDAVSVSYVDFAGSGVVHLCGGTISFVAAYIMGPRIGRFPEGEAPESGEIKGHSVPFAALGGFILMFGFLAFNGGSAGNITTPGIGKEVSGAMVNTIMSGTVAAFVYLAVHYLRHGKLTLLFTLNACLTGMVSACSACNQMEPWAAVVTGAGAGLVYMFLSTRMIILRIDDPLDAFAVHGGGGFWGLMSACIVSHKGIVYSIVHAIGGEGFDWLPFAQLGWQVVCAVAIIVWSLATMIPVFLILKKTGKLRVPAEIEIKGLDIYKHGEAAYPLHAYGHGWDDYEPIRTMKKISVVNPEISLEELASVYDHSSRPTDAPAPKKSVYHNPVHYEHPEFHSAAKYKKQVPKPGGQENGAFHA